ncbi:glycosyltransferase [Trichodesmium erythraeum 21-75]|nr:glycosyltransferase [Trichodesmium erythraeum 21-75]
MNTKSQKTETIVSIGLPVYNGENYLRGALNSLLAQDYQDFEVNICDNASTDETGKICQEYAAKDSRIIYHRSDVNIGSTKNFKQVFDLSNGKYFMWAAHDDLWEPSYISKCLKKLEENPSAVLCCSEIIFINEDNSIRHEWTDFYKNINTLGMDFSGRFHQLVNRVGWFAIYGLIRSEALREVLKEDQPAVYGLDVIQLLKLMFLGELVKVSEPLFYYRVTAQEKTATEYLNNLDPNTQQKLVPTQPFSNLARDLLKIVFESSLDIAVKQQIKKDFINTLIAKNLDWRNRILNEKGLTIKPDELLENTQLRIKNIIESVLNIETEFNSNTPKTNTEAGRSRSQSLDYVLSGIRNLPPDWHTGGALSMDVLEAIVRLVGTTEILHSIETGSGTSTLLLSHLSKDHKVFSYDCGSNGLTVARSSELLNAANVEFIEGPTQRTLPPYKLENKLQLALIDGPHGYPFPDLEYYFIYPHLEENALLIIDDIWIPTIYNLFNFLKEDQMFELVEIVGKTAFFQRTNAPILNPVGDDWFLQNYNKSRFPIRNYEVASFVLSNARKKRALVFFPHNPYPPKSGAHQRCLSILSGLKALGYDVTLFGWTLITDSPWPTNENQLKELQRQLGVKVLVYQGTQADRQFMAEAVGWAIYTPPGLEESFRQVFGQLSPEVVVVHYALWGRLAIAPEFNSVVTILDSIDLYSLNLKMGQALQEYLTCEPFHPDSIDYSVVAEDFYTKLGLNATAEEYWIFDQYNYTISISPQESDLISKHTSKTKVEYIPMTLVPVEVNNTYAEAPMLAVGPNFFNVQGCLYFAKKVLPMVLSQVPEFKLQIIGSICQKLSPVKGIELLGFVPDIKSMYAASSFAICPLIGGTGQQVKIVEAMAHGVPVIALRNVAESSPIAHGINGFIANNAEEFAEYTIRLYSDRELCRQLGEAARKTVADKCSQDLLVEKLKLTLETTAQEKSKETQATVSSPRIIVDGVFFQLYSTGIARVWRSLLQQWTKTEFAAHIIVLDRANTTPKISGIRYRQIPAYTYNNTDADKQMLQQVCDEEGADLFISTYYTTPISTPSVFMAYDMIPEVLGANFNEPMWREKHHAIGHASSYISISESTARDLVKFFPDITPDDVTVAHCGVAPTFTPATTAEISVFKYKYGISKPYFLLVGAGSNYKNAILFFRAFAQLQSKQGFEIVCTGSGVTLANEYRQYASGSVVHSLILSDEELKVAYSGAVALVYPSLYEGFGMPVAEALACGCPVITCANASIPEVVGEAAIYVDGNDVDGLTDALCEVQKPKVRNSLIAAGLEQAKKFSWGKMADIMSTALMKATLGRLNLRDINLIIFPDWTQPEETVGLELQKVMKNLVTHPDRAKMTLLIDNSNITAEDADLILSSVAMNLLMEEELEIDEGPEIVLVGKLSQVQWSALIPQLQSRIKLEHENGEAIAQIKAENIPIIELNNLARKSFCIHKTVDFT